MSYRKVLITLDGSTTAELALNQIFFLNSPDTVFHLLSVIDRTGIARNMALDETLNPLASVPTSPVVRANFMEEYVDRENYLVKIAESLRDQGYQVTLEISQGPVVDSIVTTASNGYDLLVMATRGRTGLDRLIFGSVVEQVLRTMPCPILLVSPRLDGQSPLARPTTAD